MRRKLGMIAALCLCGAMGHAQSFNIDLDEMGGTEQTGNGAPSSAFPGAALQPGLWNRVTAQGPLEPTTLYGLDGAPTSAQIYATSQGGSLYGGFNNHNLSGDFRLLMADYRFIGQPVHYHFTGFQPGRYTLYTYGGDVSGLVLNLHVDVPGSSTPEQIITGPVLPNQFQYGIDFCTHALDLIGTEFEIDLSSENSTGPSPSVQGFQIVYSPVPEPSAGIVLVVALGGYRLRRRMGAGK